MSSAETVGMPTRGRRIVLLGATILGTQCIIPLSMSVIGMAVAAAEVRGGNWRAIFVAGGKTYAEAVSVLSIFFVALIVTMTEYSLRRGVESRDPTAFWRGISTVATVSLVIGSINVFVYVGLAFGDNSGAAWKGSVLALVYAGVSRLALLFAVRARHAARVALMSSSPDS